MPRKPWRLHGVTALHERTAPCPRHHEPPPPRPSRSPATRATSRTSTAATQSPSRRYTEDADLSPVFAGLPDDRCQCEHWGYVLKGSVTFHTATGEETFEAGDAYYVAPGHTPVLTRGTEVVEFSPTIELRRTLESSPRTWRPPAPSGGDL